MKGNNSAMSFCEKFTDAISDMAFSTSPFSKNSFFNHLSLVSDSDHKAVVTESYICTKDQRSHSYGIKLTLVRGI